MTSYFLKKLKINIRRRKVPNYGPIEQGERLK